MEPFLLIWTVVYLFQYRYGVSPWIKESLPIWIRPQRQYNNPSASLKVINKMIKLVARGYMKEGVILALTSFFYMTKGKDDIRMLFDATVSGLKHSLWFPSFILPSMRSFLMMLVTEKHMVDLDVGEIFYNFWISLVLSKYCGVDLGSYLGHKKEPQGTPLWMLWVRLMMGLMLSPYAAIQVLLWVSEVVRGDSSDPDNPFRWDKIRLNLPGDPSYSPAITWMSKVWGGIKIWLQILPPMWMTPYYRQGKQNRRGGQPGEWVRFCNTWAYNMPHGRAVWPVKTEVRG